MVGKTDDADADMMPLELYHLLAYEFLKREKFMSWAWLTTAWNHVCRHDNVESLAFHMFNISQDAIRTEFDRTKTSNPESRMSSSASNPKHFFANPAEPEMCPYLSLGMWLMLARDDRSTLVFPGEKAAHKIFERDLAEVLADRTLQGELKILGITRDHRITCHSTRKGAATTLASADCTGGFLVAICRRGDWSITTVLDAYLKCTIGGDQTLGRILAGLDPNKSDFDLLPPHFLAGSDVVIQQGLSEVWGDEPTAVHKIEDGRYEPIIQRFMASVVYHHDFFVTAADRHDEDQVAV